MTVETPDILTKNVREGELKYSTVMMIKVTNSLKFQNACEHLFLSRNFYNRSNVTNICTEAQANKYSIVNNT